MSTAITRAVNYIQAVIWLVPVKNTSAGGADKPALLVINGANGQLSLPHVYVRAPEDIIKAVTRLFNDVLVLHGAKPNIGEKHLFVHGGRPIVINVINGEFKIPDELSSDKPGSLQIVEFPIVGSILDKMEPWCVEMLSTIFTKEEEKKQK